MWKIYQEIKQFEIANKMKHPELSAYEYQVKDENGNWINDGFKIIEYNVEKLTNLFIFNDILNEDNIYGPWKLHNDGWKYLTRNSYYRYDNYDNNCCFRRRKWVLIEKMPTKIEKLIFGYNFFSYDVQEITFI